MKNRKRSIQIIIGAVAAVLLMAAAVFWGVHYFSAYRQNTRALTRKLKAAQESTGGQVDSLFDIEYDKLYVFEPYAPKERMQRVIGFETGVLQESVSEGCINYLFVKDNEVAAYLYGLPENIGYCINLKSGVYMREQLSEMSYEVQSREAGNTLKKSKTYQDYNFYFKDQVEEPVDSVVVQAVNAVTAVPVGEEVTVSLNADGQDTVYYSVADSEESEPQVEKFTVNGKDFTRQIRDLNCTRMNRDSYYIVDLVGSDDYKEIALYDEGPSGDPETHFFRYYNDKLVYLGSITDYPDSGTCHFQNQGGSQGEIVAAFRLNILQTWFAQSYWKLSGGRLTFQEQSVYYPVTEYKAQLLSELPVYENPDKESREDTMQLGEVSFQATDNKNWVQIEDKSGKQGWFYVEDYDTIADVGLRAQEVFSGLQIVD